MFINKEIIVVAPEKYNEFSRRMSHEISKISGLNCANWSIKHFNDNEFQMGGNRYVILIGNSEENKLTGDFLPVISNLIDNNNSFYGFDGTKAVAYGSGNKSEETLSSDNFDGLFNSFEVKSTFTFGIVGYGIQKIREHRSKTELLKSQTEKAINSFMSELLHSWLEIEK